MKIHSDSTSTWTAGLWPTIPAERVRHSDISHSKEIVVVMKGRRLRGQISREIVPKSVSSAFWKR